MRIKAIKAFTGKEVERFYWLKKMLHNVDKNQKSKKTKVKKQINANSQNYKSSKPGYPGFGH
jgi:hypothetical protein